MGSPVSTVITELVIQEIEERALFRQSDQSGGAAMSTIQTRALRETTLRFFSHLNLINASIRFTLEMPTITMGKTSTRTAQRKAKELLLGPYWTALNVFRLRLHADVAKNDALSTTRKLMAILKTSSSRSINQTTHNKSLGRTQKHMHKFHTLKVCQSALDEF